MNLWELLDSPPPYATGVAELYSWALNCLTPSPYDWFLDLTGLSIEHYGDLRFLGFRLENIPTMGLIECSVLAAALEEYACRPFHVSDFVGQLHQAERNES